MFGRIKQRERKAAEALAAEVKAQREATLELVERYEQRTRKTVQAIEAASKAREQRDEYRRVLAAAIANERRQEIHVAGLESELKELKEGVLAEARARGAAEAAEAAARSRVAELEAELREAAACAERARGDAADRAWAEREAARAEMVQLVARTREDAATLTSEVRRVLSWLGAKPRDASGAPVEDPAAVSVHRQRGRLLAGLAAASVLTGLALAPMALLAAVDAERAAYVHLASGLSPVQLVLSVVAAFGLALFLYGKALRDLRPAEGAPASGSSPSDEAASAVESGGEPSGGEASAGPESVGPESVGSESVGSESVGSESKEEPEPSEPNGEGEVDEGGVDDVIPGPPPSTTGGTDGEGDGDSEAPAAAGDAGAEERDRLS